MFNAIEIIAENAQGFEGDPFLAKQLVRAAAASGANAAKFQLVYADELATPEYEYYSQNKELEMPDHVWKEIFDYAAEQKIELIFDIFGPRSLKLAEDLGCKSVMLHATDITNFDLIKRVSVGPIERVIFGAGGAYLSEIQDAIEAIGRKDVCLMLGYQGYPTPDEDNQISRVRYLSTVLSDKFPNVTIGFSDHSIPDSELMISLSSMALGAGARSFEKHLTIAETMHYEDYESAINPDKFHRYTYDLRECSKAFGSTKMANHFGMRESEKNYRKFVRRHVVTANCLSAGEKVLAKDFVFKRSSIEGAITEIDQILGMTVSKDLKENSAVTMKDFK